MKKGSGSGCIPRTNWSGSGRPKNIRHTDPATVLIIEPMTRIRINKNYVSSCGFVSVIWPKKGIQSHSIEITTGPKREVKVTQSMFFFIFLLFDGRIRIRICEAQKLTDPTNTKEYPSLWKQKKKNQESLYLEFHLCFRASRGSSAWLSPVQQHLPATSGKLIMRTILTAIYGPKIHRAPCSVTFSCGQIHYEGKWEGWSLEIETFLVPAKWHGAVRRVPFLGPKKGEISTAQPPPTCPRNGFPSIKSITYRIISIRGP